MMTTPFIGSGFIDKRKLDKDPNNVFQILGLDESVKNFKFKGQVKSVRKQGLISQNAVTDSKSKGQSSLKAN